MIRGAGKLKGGKFERLVCKQLSAWVTGGQRKDVFWRSAMSGGRATVHGSSVRQAGDVTAVAPEGHALTDKYMVECKHERDLQFDRFTVQHRGPLMRYWLKLNQQCHVHDRLPMLVARQNGWPVLVLLTGNNVPHAFYPRCFVRADSGSIAVIDFAAMLKTKFKHWML